MNSYFGTAQIAPFGRVWEWCLKPLENGHLIEIIQNNNVVASVHTSQLDIRLAHIEARYFAANYPQGEYKPKVEPDSVMIWKCTGRLYNERDTSWMWVDYRQSRASAMAACEAQALGNNEGVLTWEEETDIYSRATTDKRRGWIYELELINVKP